MAKIKVTDLVSSLLEDFLKEHDYELFRTEFVKEVKDWYLRVYIEKCRDGIYENVGTDDCELVSRYLSEKMDGLDPIEQNYYLEVSSPGMDRPLLCEAHYERFQGELAEVSLYEAIDGQKLIVGKLEGLVDGRVVLTDEKSRKVEIPMDKIARAKLAVVF